MYEVILQVRISAIEIALLTRFLHQELSDLFPEDPESVLVIEYVVLGKVIGDGGLEPSCLSEIPGLNGLKSESPKIKKLMDRLKKEGWIRQKSDNGLLVPGDIFRTRGDATIDHLNRMINQVYKSLHRDGDHPKGVDENVALDKLLKSIWDKESAENDSLIDL